MSIPKIPLKTIHLIREKFEKKLTSYSVRKYSYDDNTIIYEINDSLLIACEISIDDVPLYDHSEDMYVSYSKSIYLEIPNVEENYYRIDFEEITYNDIGFKYNHKMFLCEVIEFLGINIYLDDVVKYSRFKGYKRLYWCPDVKTTAERMDEMFPYLGVRKRYDLWEGVNYNFLIIDFKDVNGKIHHAVAYTKNSPQSYMIKLGNFFIKHGCFTDSLRSSYTDLLGALQSWKGTSRKDRLEKNLFYCCESKRFREKDDVWRYADTLLEKANNGFYNSHEKSGYLRPVNKWISEELVYKITKNLYKEYAVIYQHRPYFLRSSFGGQMSYDVYISKLNVAIEYQGKQHFEPIDFFGGEENFDKLKIRDEEKRLLSKKHGVKLVYINYFEEITKDLIKERVEN